VLDFGDVTLCKHVITYVTEDLKLFCFGQCSTLAAGLNGLDDSCFEHDEERKSEGGQLFVVASYCFTLESYCHWHILGARHFVGVVTSDLGTTSDT
jgi:hypothetical protein